MHALEYDCHAAFGAEIENLNDYLLYDCIVWGSGEEFLLYNDYGDASKIEIKSWIAVVAFMLLKFFYE